MDPPESYCQATIANKGLQWLESKKPGTIALGISLGSLVPAGLLFLLTGNGLALWIPYFLFLAGQIAGLVLGALAWKNPLGKAAVITSALLIVLSVLFMT